MTIAFAKIRHHLVFAGQLALAGFTVAACRAESSAVAASAEVAPLTIPAWTNEGSGREVEVLLEAEGVKIAAIALRRGTELPVHSVESRVSIQVLRGVGQMTADGEAIAVQAGSMVVLGPSVAHAVKPAGDELMVLLLHYLDTDKSTH